MSKALPNFMPVIFANGKDDDSYGLAAWMQQDQPVLFNGRVYRPSDHLRIYGLHLVFSRGLKMISPSGETIFWIGGEKRPIVTDWPTDWADRNGRKILTICHCHLDADGGVFYKHPDAEIS